MIDNTISIDVEANGFEEATESVNMLTEAIGNLPAQVKISSCKGCTFNIYPSQVVSIENEGNKEEHE